MRHGAGVMCVWMMSACGIENELRHTSTLQAETDGVVLSEDGFDSFAAMSGTTCTVDTAWGCPVADEDLPTSEERLFDHYLGLTLGGSAQGVHTIDGAWMPDLDLDIGSVHHAKLTDQGVVVLSGDEQSCVVQQGGVSVEVPGSACRTQTTVAVDRVDSTLLIGTPDGTLRIASGAADWLNPDADLVALDPVTQVVVTAARGDTRIRAELGGEIVWEVDSEGSVQSITPRGNRGELVVMVKMPDGFGAIERYDAGTGEHLASSTIPTGEGEVVVANNGHVVGVVRDEEVHYYAFGIAGEPEPIDATPPKGCMDGWNVESRD